MRRDEKRICFVDMVYFVFTILMCVELFATDSVSKFLLNTCYCKETSNMLSIDGLHKEIRGIQYTCKEGNIYISGTPLASSSIDLLGSKNEIPSCLKSGDRLHMRFPSGTKYITLGIKGFNNNNPDGLWLVKTSNKTDFIVPDLSKYTGMVVRVLVSKADRCFDLKVKPEIFVQNINKRYLTIIDDDGDIHYKTDIIPFMQKLGISISSAVTPTRVGTEVRWMSWKDIKYCDEMGGEILCHMYKHYTGTEIEAVDNSTLLTEFELARKEFKNRGLDNGKFLVYSSNTGNIPRIQEMASKCFTLGIKIGGNEVNNQYSNTFSLSRFRIDYAETEKRKSWNYPDMIAYVNEIVENGGWGIWMIHTSNSMYRQRVKVDEEGNVLLDSLGNPIPMIDESGKPIIDTDGKHPTVGWTVFLPMLEKSILYAMENGVEIVSVEQGYRTFYKQ